MRVRLHQEGSVTGRRLHQQVVCYESEAAPIGWSVTGSWLHQQVVCYWREAAPIGSLLLEGTCIKRWSATGRKLY